MTDYIKRSEAIRAMAQYMMDMALIDNTDDVVEVVRCKDCKYYHKEWNGSQTHYYKDYWCEWVEPDENNFCSYGERAEA